jgi:fermentation-respiration switch protein FrsA (DUF1100 family)
VILHERTGKIVRHRLLRAIGLLIATVIVVYLAAVGYLYLFQRSYVFAPGGSLATPAEEGLEQTEIVSLRSADGTELTGWYREADPGLPTILYFHGNAGNISDRADRFQQIAASGFGFLAFSYRGYAGSGGLPSEATLFSDGLETFDWLAARSGAIVVHGESLGTAVATYVAAERPTQALILEAPFTAAVDIAAATYPWVPVSFLMRDPFLSREAITKVSEPVLIAHGTEDIVVPVDHGRRLFEFAREPKRLAIFEGAGHANLWDRGLWETVREFLAANGVTAHAWVRRIPSLAG